MTKLSRRVFLGSAPAAAAAAGIFGTFFSTAAEAAIKWDETYNVIVIGAGGAGLSAAVSAKEAGAKKVVVLEKMMFAGGNTIRAGGGFNAAIKADYEKAGITDSPKLHAEQTLVAGDGRGDPVLVHQLTEKLLKAFSGSKTTASNSRITSIRSTAVFINAPAIRSAREAAPTLKLFLKSARKKTFLSSTTHALLKSSANIS